MTETVELALNNPSDDMWDKVLSTFKAALAKAEEAYVKKATSAFSASSLLSVNLGNDAVVGEVS
jgi:hypothetical protein